MNFLEYEPVTNIELQITIMAHVFGFMQQIGNQLLSGFPIFADHGQSKVAQHVFADRQMLWCHGIIAMQFMQ